MPEHLVLVDTDVWSETILTVRDRDPRVTGWRRLLLGAGVLVSAQTEGEIRFGALVDGWGAERLARLDAHLARTPTAPITADVVRAFATLRASCRAQGHPIANKQHMGDAWIAATAIGHDIPLLSGDRIFPGVPGLTLLSDEDL